MGKYLKVVCTSEIPKNQMKAFKADGREILVANVEGKFYAVSNRCLHMNYPFYLGSHRKGFEREATFGLVAGFVIMMLLDCLFT
jgi:nitrite reductase/ring-hydroxylating ferredoxin subunit